MRGSRIDATPASQAFWQHARRRRSSPTGSAASASSRRYFRTLAGMAAAARARAQHHRRRSSSRGRARASALPRRALEQLALAHAAEGVLLALRDGAAGARSGVLRPCRGQRRRPRGAAHRARGRRPRPGGEPVSALDPQGYAWARRCRCAWRAEHLRDDPRAPRPARCPPGSLETLVDDRREGRRLQPVGHLRVHGRPRPSQAVYAEFLRPPIRGRASSTGT